MRFSIIIPTYNMNRFGHIFLDVSLGKLMTQSIGWDKFEVIVSDQSDDDLVERTCDKYNKYLNIKYIKNTGVKGCSANLNFAMKYAKGELIKFLFQDDYLYNDDALKIISNHFKEQDMWLVTACEHSMDGVTNIRPFYPIYNDAIHLGNNTISSPSVLTIRNKDIQEFDENLKWLLDCEYYKRLNDKFGSPTIVNVITVVNRIGAHQVTNTMITDNIVKYEYEYVKNKHANNSHL